jgi:hypothetical protein
MKKIKYATLKQIAKELGGDPYAEYSGRGMYGKFCAGVVIDYSVVSDLSEAIRDAGASAVLTKAGRSQDSMGLRTIIYWTDVTCPDAPEDEE